MGGNITDAVERLIARARRDSVVIDYIAMNIATLSALYQENRDDPDICPPKGATKGVGATYKGIPIRIDSRFEISEQDHHLIHKIAIRKIRELP